MDLIPRLEDIREDVKEISEEDISRAVNIPKERARLRKKQLQAQAIRDEPLTSVDGTGVPRDDNRGATWKVMSALPPAMITTPRLLDMDVNRSRLAAHEILTRLSQGSLDKKSVSLPPSTFFPSLYGYYKRPDDGIRIIRSEPSSKPKNIVSTFRTKVRFLPPIATLYPTDNGKDIS
ncbi:PREDICTED: uncharacterized protein LOC107338647 [Acropora digitifera]|uniref:uncharacterized protein LOC107338647 n=1 Tax=Acropora digitifera TaxID=70779 RepID=UPI00077AE378|nr:PREDICTED: uncharacterized protein LOC107338647 [Acropora digitifera]